MMIQEGDTLLCHFFTHEIVVLWKKIPILIEDYPYACMDYQGDPEMPRPPGQIGGPDGM